jgi:formylmethanofuran dehydrogenase subunit E
MEKIAGLKAGQFEGLVKCIEFHGHLCPGLVYGYLVGKESVRIFGLERSKDEEIVAVSENDSCSVDALQIILGTTTGKGNLILKDYGKNVYTVISRHAEKAYRFSRKNSYEYTGKHKAEFDELESAVASGKATPEETKRQKILKATDLLKKPFEDVFFTEEVIFPMPPFAPLAPSRACEKCGEMTMSTKMIKAKDGICLCVPCTEAE